DIASGVQSHLPELGARRLEPLEQRSTAVPRSPRHLDFFRQVGGLDIERAIRLGRHRLYEALRQRLDLWLGLGQGSGAWGGRGGRRRRTPPPRSGRGIDVEEYEARRLPLPGLREVLVRRLGRRCWRSRA